MMIVFTVSTYVLGTVLREAQEANSQRLIEEQFAEVSEEEKIAALREFTSRIRATGRYPQMAALIEQGVDPDATETRDYRFEFGLKCLLDGIAARIPAIPPPDHKVRR